MSEHKELIESLYARAEAAEVEVERLRTVIRTGGQMLGAERAALGVTAPDGCTMDYCEHDMAEQWRAGREAAVERVRELERVVRDMLAVTPESLHGSVGRDVIDRARKALGQETDR